MKHEGSVDASSFRANRVNDLHCLAFKVSEENRGEEALQECKQSHLEPKAVSTHAQFFFPQHTPSVNTAENRDFL